MITVFIFLVIMFGKVAFCIFAVSFFYHEAKTTLVDPPLCTKDFCKDVKCPETSPYCDYQNTTHNGILLPSVDFCNCCPFCVEYILEGQVCSKGSLDAAASEIMCGPGLFCTEEGTNPPTCQKITGTPCTDKREDYQRRMLSGDVGSMEQELQCDDVGDFAPYQCIPGQTCHCLHQNGSRLFGETDFTDIPQLIFKCECSRMATIGGDLVEERLGPGKFFRCKQNGDFDEVQCINDQCFCVDPSDGSPLDNDIATVNITDTRNETLSCFTIGRHVEGYYTACEQEYLAKVDLYESLAKDYEIVMPAIYPNCDLDGGYGAVQENDTHKFCVGPSGNILMPEINKADNPELANSMNCKCIRTSSIMSGVEKPDCDLNGNFKPLQCRRGTCRCVDEDGNQICSSTVCEGGRNLDCSSITT